MTIENDMNDTIRLRDKPYSPDNAHYLASVIFEEIALLDKIVRELPKADSNGFIDFLPQSDVHVQKNDLIKQLSGYQELLVKYIQAAEHAMADIRKKSGRIKKDRQLLNSPVVINKYIDASEGLYHEFTKHKEARDQVHYLLNYMKRSMNDGVKKKYPKKRPVDPEFLKMNVNTIFQKEAHGDGQTHCTETAKIPQNVQRRPYQHVQDASKGRP